MSMTSEQVVLYRERNKKKLTVRHVLKVDIGVSQRSPGDHVAANANGQNGTDRAEFLEQHSFGHVRM